MSAVIEPATDELPLNPATLGCIALMRLKQSTPESTWDRLSPETRRSWLRLGNDPQGYSGIGWAELPASVRWRLRLSLRGAMALFSNIGADLL